MPDFEPFPRRPRAPVFEPRTGDYAAVAGRAKHRRRRHLSAAGAGVAGLVAVVALSTGGAGGSFGLDPAPPAAGIPQGADETPVATASPQPTPDESVAPGEDPAESGQPGYPGEPGSGGQQDPEDDGAVLIDPDPVPVREPQRPEVTRDDIAMSPTQICDSDLSVLVQSTGWCLHYEGPSTAKVGDYHEYRILACRHYGRGGLTLTFDSEQQVDYAVTTQNGREEWRWSAGYPFPKRTTTVRVEDGHCARWTVDWDATGSDGDPLRAGDYWMSPEISPSSWGEGQPGMVTGSSYSLTLTD